MKRDKKRLVQKKATTQKQTNNDLKRSVNELTTSNPKNPDPNPFVHGRKPNFPKLLAPGLRAATSMERIAAMCVCTGCGETTYKPILVIGCNDDYYKTLHSVEAQIFNKEFPKRHSSGVYENEKMKEQDLPSGYAYCGYWTIVALWKLWEAP